MKTMVVALCMGIAWGTLQAYAQAQAPQDRSAARPHRPDEAGRAAAIYRRADTNSDGKVSFEELQALRPQMTHEQFRRIDRDADGFLTPADRPPPEESRNGDEKIHRQMLTKMLSSDRDGDGAVTYEELTHAKPGFPRSNFKRLDLNRDGVLTIEDLSRPQRAGGRPHPVREGNRERNPGPPDRDALMKRLLNADADGNRQLTLEEVQRLFPAISEERFRRLDRNGDGVLTRGEGPKRPNRPADR